MRAGRRRLSRDERLAYLILLPALGAVFVIVTIPFVLVIVILNAAAAAIAFVAYRSVWRRHWRKVHRGPAAPHPLPAPPVPAPAE